MELIVGVTHVVAIGLGIICGGEKCNFLFSLGRLLHLTNAFFFFFRSLVCDYC